MISLQIRRVSSASNLRAAWALRLHRRSSIRQQQPRPTTTVCFPALRQLRRRRRRPATRPRKRTWSSTITTTMTTTKTPPWWPRTSRPTGSQCRCSMGPAAAWRPTADSRTRPTWTTRRQLATREDWARSLRAECLKDSAAAQPRPQPHPHPLPRQPRRQRAQVRRPRRASRREVSATSSRRRRRRH